MRTGRTRRGYCGRIRELAASATQALGQPDPIPAPVDEAVEGFASTSGGIRAHAGKGA